MTTILFVASILTVFFNFSSSLQSTAKTNLRNLGRI